MRKLRSLTDWIWQTGGIRYHATSKGKYEGELRDIFTDFVNGKKRRAKGVTATLLNNKTGRGLDEIVTEANSYGFMVNSEDNLIELLAQDIKGKAEGDLFLRVYPMHSLEDREELLWQQYIRGEL